MLRSQPLMRDRPALLDGEATHCLRQAADEAEWKSGIEVEVALVSGTAMLRQNLWTKTLVTQQPVQPIVPLGCLAELGYAIKWESRSFELQDSKGRILEEELGLQLIKEIEKQVMLQKARLAVLRGGEGPGMASMSKTTVEWSPKLRKLFPEVPAELLERVVPDDRIF